MPRKTHVVSASALTKYRRMIYSSRIGRFAALLIFVSSFALVLTEHYKENLGNIPYEVLKNLTLAFVSSVVIASAMQVYTTFENIDIIKQEVGELFTNKMSSKGVETHGVVQIHNGMPHQKLIEDISSHNEMFILQTWIADITSIKKHVQSLCKRNGRLKVLILDPDSNIVGIRSKELGLRPEYLAYSIINSIEDCLSISEDLIEIRLHSNTPSVSIYGFNDIMYVGNYLYRLHAIQGPQIELRDSIYFQNMLDHFQNIWEISRTVDKKVYLDLLRRHAPDRKRDAQTDI